MMQKFPVEFIERMQNQLGGDFTDFIESLNKPVPVSIRYNNRKMPGININQTIAWEPMGTYLEERPVFTLDPLFHAGGYYVQEASSMFTGWIANKLMSQQTGLRILDLCAAPGGKSTHLASFLDEHSLLVSNEVIGSRASILAENMVKWGCPNVFVSRNDPKDFNQISSFFDLVFVDAPCSGEGLFRRDEHAIEEWSPENARHCALRQQRIVSDIWNSLKPGGYLIYSTCTFNPAENDENIKWILEKTGSKTVQFDIPEDWNIKQVGSNDFFGYQFFPHKVRGEGFFISVIQKTNDRLTGQAGDTHGKLVVKTDKNLKNPVKSMIAELNDYFSKVYSFTYFITENEIQAVPTVLEQEYCFLRNKLHLVEAGIRTARVFGEKLVPEHNLALSWALNRNRFNAIELDKTMALQFLHRDAIFIPGFQQGINLVTYQKLPLGWIKNIGNRWNNLYPQNWRIRMDIHER